MKKIHIIGLGLLGGSFGLGARQKFPELIITGTDANPQNLKDALTLGIITEAKETPDADTDLVILATPADTLGKILIDTLNQVAKIPWYLTLVLPRPSYAE